MGMFQLQCFDHQICWNLQCKNAIEEKEARKESCKDHGLGEMIQFQYWPLRDEANRSLLFPKESGELVMTQGGVIYFPYGKKLRQWPYSVKLGAQHYNLLLSAIGRGSQAIGQRQETEFSLFYYNKDRKENKDSNIWAEVQG